MEVVMQNEKKGIDQNASETTDARPQGGEVIEDLPPNDDASNDVRGGILPPSDVRLGVLPPNERPGEYLVPPST
jgi:hypothetical protein